MRTRLRPFALAAIVGMSAAAIGDSASAAGESTTLRLVAAANTVDTVISEVILRQAYARFDAALAFPVKIAPAREHPGCRCGEVLRGVLLPTECRLFGRVCTPQSPVGPCMVSAEGACAAYYRYDETRVHS